MKVLLFLVADYANVSQDNKLNVMGIFNDINAYRFPARHPSMHLVSTVAPELGEYGEERTLTIKLLDQDGTEILKVSGKIEFPHMQGRRKPEVNAIIELKDVIFPKPGPYQFVVMVDKEYKSDLTIYLNQVGES